MSLNLYDERRTSLLLVGFPFERVNVWQRVDWKPSLDDRVCSKHFVADESMSLNFLGDFLTFINFVCI